MTEPIKLELTIEELKLIDKYVELNDDTQQLFDKIKSSYPQPRMKFLFDGKFEVVSYNKKSYYRFEFPDEVYWYRRTSHETYLDLKLERITDGETHRLLEGLWFNEVKGGKYPDEVECPDEPLEYDEVEWDEKDNPKPMDDVVNRLIKQHQAQKLWNRVRDELGYSIDCVNEIVDLVEDWILDEQSAAGSQNVNTELLVDGFNDCVRKMKEMLR